MKYLTTAGLCLVSLVVIGMVLAGSALAAPLVLVCSEGSNSGNTKYEDSSCTKALSTGKWESVALGDHTDKVVGTNFTLTLTDINTPLGQTSVRCDKGGKSEGTIGPLNFGVITKATIEKASENCRGIDGGCESNKIEEVQGVGLPWQGVLFETEHEFVGRVEPDGNGEPGWSVKCKTVLGSKTDTCRSEGAHEEAVLQNVVSNGVLLVLGTLALRGKQECTEGGKESGIVDGQAAGLLANGDGLSINPS